MYKIIRFYNPKLNKLNEVVKEVETESEAIAHCQGDDTKEEGVYFSGFTKVR